MPFYYPNINWQESDYEHKFLKVQIHLYSKKQWALQKKKIFI